MQEDAAIAFIRELSELSAQVILPHFAQPDLAVELKPDASPVTVADRDAEKVMREAIRRRYPSHGIIGEEFGNEQEDAEFVWVLDPIDGTKAFTAHCPLFGTLICLMRSGEPWIGAVHQPVCRQLFLGNGEQAWLNNRRIRVSEVSELSQARLVTWDLDFPRKHESATTWDALLGAVGQKRTWGDCYGYALLASGGVEISCDVAMNPWDIMALIPLIRGAGGKISDWRGGDPVRGDSLIAVNAALHEVVLGMLNP